MYGRWDLMEVLRKAMSQQQVDLLVVHYVWPLSFWCSSNYLCLVGRSMRRRLVSPGTIIPSQSKGCQLTQLLSLGLNNIDYLVLDVLQMLHFSQVINDEEIAFFVHVVLSY